MAVNIVRGGTCRIVFKPLGGLNVADLGTPEIAISQDITYVSPDNVVVDVANNRVYADLTEAQTMQLVDGAETKTQVVFTNEETQDIYRFPIHNLTVSETLFDKFYVQVSYIAVTPSEFDIPTEEGWYELVEGEYVPTQDTTPVEGKTYYWPEER